VHSIIIYMFPLILISFETLLRNLSSVDTFGFIGPTLAATAISLLLPLTKVKEFKIESDDGQQWVKVSKYEQNFSYFIWLLLFVSLFIWFWVCSLSMQNSTIELFNLPTHIVIGSCLYILSVILSAVKDYLL